ncbi:F-box protein At2g35280-like [Beta vulgaris subsp. vulgaris]|uniref:F-box protein At2g35280-like n=1 Tax=Beta vulgaris subsp. vulgaris TaxID=3555 RepID=UPI0025474142|nr:F-box protein At2g35280-like [Beta vulgaris subsp. vulgaris]
MKFPTAKKPNIVHALPTEIIIEILSRVGTASAPDLFACRLTCKAINKMSHDEKIYKKVSFEHLYMRSLRNDENKTKFFDLCLQYKNPEALLRYGMVQYFTYVLLDEGLKNIDLAHSKDEVVQLRGTLRDMMVSLWLNNSIVRESDELVKCDQGHLHAYDNIVDKWDYFAWGPDDLNNLCDAYLCNREAAFFLRLLH